jgi:hypothetical protein
MVLDALLAYLHFIAIFVLFAFLTVQAVMLRRPLDEPMADKGNQHRQAACLFARWQMDRVLRDAERQSRFVADLTGHR